MYEISSDYHRFEAALLSVDWLAAKDIIARRPEQISAVDYVENLITPALERIGRAWEAGNAALAQVYMAGRICEQLVDEILPPASPDRKNQPKMAIAVLRDFHQLGKRIVYSIMRASGFELIDYGHADEDDLVRRTAADGVDVLLISTLMLPSALGVKVVRERLQDLGRTVRIIVGGAPFRLDEGLWKEVGADAMGWNASDAVRIVKGMMEATNGRG
jgi:methanogenic corrinoid protein MtbC1